MKTQPYVFTTRVLAYSAVMILSGSFGIIALQKQKYYNFKHGLTMCQEMFIGEIMALFSLVLPLLASRKKNFVYFLLFKKELNSLKQPSILIIGFGGCLDALASCLELAAILLIPSTLYALMKNGSILFTALFTIVMLRRPLYRHHWLGIFTTFLGFTVMTVCNFLSSTEVLSKHEANNIYLGAFLMLVSLVFSSLQFVYQEYLFGKYSLDPKRVVGNEGIVGACLLSIALVATSTIECQYDGVCERGKPFDSPAQAVLQMIENPSILVAGVIAVLSMMTFNVSGVSLTKMVSALFRRMVDSLRTILIWGLSWILGFDENDWQSFLIELAGLTLLVLGNLIYNEIVEVSLFGFDKYVKNKDLQNH